MKPGLFSFIGDEFENVFQYSDLFLPGIEKIAGIYYSTQDQQLKILSRSRNEEIDDQFDDLMQKRENVIMIQKYRSAYQQFAWINKGDLPFELTSQQRLKVQTLFTELENVILILRFQNKSDSLYDLLLIYFNKNLGNFGLNKSEKALTADHKLIIGHLLYYQFKAFLQMNLKNRSLLHKLNNGVRSVIHENMSLKDQLINIQSNYGDNMVNIAKQSLLKIGSDYSRNYILTDEAVKKIREFKGNLKYLPDILENAVIFTENLMVLNEEDTVKIQPYSLDFDSYQVVNKTEQLTRKIDSRQSRAMQLLDKLERAASNLKSKNISITSSKVGKEMDPPISAPAITDSLGKSRDLIRQLLVKYPEKWENIRNDFKPLLNAVKKSEPDLLQEGRA